MRERGATLQEIGQKFNLSRERVRQILLKRAAQKREKAKIKRMRFTRNAPVSILQLSTRSSNCLRNENIKTVRELLAYSEVELLRLPNFGMGSLQEVKRALARHRCRLADKPRPTAGLPTFNVNVAGLAADKIYSSALLRAVLSASSNAADAWSLTPGEAGEVLSQWSGDFAAAEQRLRSLLKLQAMLAEDGSPEGEAAYLRCVTELARVQAEITAQQQKAANGKGSPNGH
jgi:hypothetical protein